MSRSTAVELPTEYGVVNDSPSPFRRVGLARAARRDLANAVVALGWVWRPRRLVRIDITIEESDT